MSRNHIVALGQQHLVLATARKQAASPQAGKSAAEAKATDAPDFSGDTSPSVAPDKITVRPKPRPDKKG